MEKATKDLLYKHYDEWKEWDGDAISQPGIFHKELLRAEVSENARILEFGFGDGGFLDWGRQQGYQVKGVERTQSLIDRAKKRGHDVYLEGSNQFSLTEADFDVIIVFDVLEHLTLDEILMFLDRAKQLLVTGGVIIARVPNCASPYGLAYQNGDFTHLTQLSEERFRHLAIIKGMKCAGVYSSAVSAKDGRWSFLRKIVFSLRDLHGLIISYLYFGKRTLMSPAITAVLKKAN